MLARNSVRGAINVFSQQQQNQQQQNQQQQNCIYFFTG